MTNRIRHVLQEWNPEQPESEPPAAPTGGGAAEPPIEERRPHGPHPMPRGINMLMPVELCINRNLLISLLSASIAEMTRHKKREPGTLSPRETQEMEAMLQQQVAFRTWIKEHPMSYISMALYPVSEADVVEDLEDLGDTDQPGA